MIPKWLSSPEREIEELKPMKRLVSNSTMCSIDIMLMRAIISDGEDDEACTSYSDYDTGYISAANNY